MAAVSTLPLTTNASPASLLASRLQGLPQSEIARRLSKLLTPTELTALEYQWPFWARPNQLAPEGEWFIWLIQAGRGWGKTRSAAEYVRKRIEAGDWQRVALVNDTAEDTRKVMVEGPDGLLNICPPWNRPVYEPAKKVLTWPNGAQAHMYEAEAPEKLRGPQHDGAWVDEPAKWRNLRKPDPQGGTAWDNLMFGLRMGNDPRCVVGTTPRPIKWMQTVIKAPTTVITRGATYENRANLAERYMQTVIAPYEGTRLGRQELHGEIMDDIPGALWTRQMIENARVANAPDLLRIVVAIDPAVTSGEDSDETGIVAAGKSESGDIYVLRDISGRFTPRTWAERAINLYEELRADRIIGEVNNGGDLVEANIRTVDAGVPFTKVTATRGKRVRAEPIASLYEQGKVHHVGGFPELEDQMCNFTPDGYDGSPDRLDALVWACSELTAHGAWVVR